METRTAYIKQIKGISFVGRTDSNHWVAMDGPAEFEGAGAGIRPKEMLLLALGGCTGSDVVNILRKKRADVQNFEIKVTGELSDEHPKVFTSMHVEFVFHGNNLNEKDIERAIELSETKYCSVTRMLKASIKITNSYRIVDPNQRD